MKLFSKRTLLQSLLVVIFIGALGRTQDVSSLIASLQDQDPAVRMSAFYTLLKVGFGTTDQLKLAAIDLLVRETAFVHDPTPLPASMASSYGAYYSDVVQTVAKLNDTRAINALLGVIDTGDIVTRALAGFGDASIDAIIAQAQSPESDVRSGAAAVLAEYLELGTVTNSASLARIRLALTTLAMDADYYVSVAGIDGLTTLGSTTSAGSAMPFTGRVCNGFFGGPFVGDLTVSTGQTCIISNGNVRGHLMVTGGSVVVLSGTTLQGNVQITGGTFFLGASTTLNGNVEIHNLPVGGANNHICGAVIGGNLQVHNDGAAIEIGDVVKACPGVSVAGNLEIMNNAGVTRVYNDNVGGNLHVANNTEAKVFNNTVANNLQCEGNSSITGGSNTAKQKQGQCAGF